MARPRGPRRGTLDPLAQAIRVGHTRCREQNVAQWWTAENAARWEAERAQLDAGSALVVGTAEMFKACLAVGLDREANRFTFAVDRQQSRRWLVPGSEGGPVVECDAEGMPL